MRYINNDGIKIKHKSAQDKLLNQLYSHVAGRIFLKILVQPFFSKIAGRILNSRFSIWLISPFVKRHGIELSQYETDKFNSYNSFFTRQIKREYRPIAEKETSLISPCDGKVSVYPITQGRIFWIKNTSYTIESLFHSHKIAEHFKGGYACIFRLTVEDYHRYCYMDHGMTSKIYRINGVFHTVNPIANEFYPIYKENTREFSLLKSEHFGKIAVMEVGALLVGKIKNYYGKTIVRKGQEKGRFEFGGSTIVVLLEKDSVSIQPDLLENTKNGYETTVKMGETIATALSRD